MIEKNAFAKKKVLEKEECLRGRIDGICSLENGRKVNRWLKSDDED